MQDGAADITAGSEGRLAAGGAWADRLGRLGLLGGIAGTAWLFLLHLRMIFSPAPQEMREAGELVITQLLLQGRNPYAPAELPVGTDVYGILYNAVVTPFAALFGNSLAVHRAVSGVAILAACLLVHRLLRQRGSEPGLAIAGTLLFYFASIYFVAPLARPDGVALLLSVAAIAVLYRDEVSVGRFLLGLGLAVAALFTKLYLAYPPFVLAAWLFLFRARWRGLALGAGALATAILALAAATLLLPAYLNVVVLANAHSAVYEPDHLLRQTRDWVLYQLPLFVALAVLAWRSGGRMRLDLWGFTVLANGAVFLVWLGGHSGAHMTYLLQLVSPALILALWPHLPWQGWGRGAVLLALPLTLGLNAHWFPQSFADFARAEDTHRELERKVAQHITVLGGTEAASVLLRAGRPVLDTGQSEYFAAAVGARALPLLVPPAVLQARWDGMRAEIENGIEGHRYDLVVRSRRRGGVVPAELLARHYRTDGSFEVSFSWAGQRWPLDLWVPQVGANAAEGGKSP